MMEVVSGKLVTTGVIRCAKIQSNRLVRAPGIDPLCFLAGCRTRRLNQALSVLSLSLGFFCAVN